MKARNSICAIFLAAFATSTSFAQTPATDDSAFAALRTALAGNTGANALVRAADRISDPSTTFPEPLQSAVTDGGQIVVVEIPPFAYDPASFPAEELHWSAYCDGQRIVSQKLLSDWGVILDALQDRAEALGISTDDLDSRNYNFFSSSNSDDEWLRSYDVYFLWRKLAESGLASDESTKKIFSEVGWFYLEALSLQEQSNFCHADEQRLILGLAGMDQAIEMIKANIMIDQPDLTQFSDEPSDTSTPPDIDHLKLESSLDTTTVDDSGIVVVASADSFPTERNVAVAALKEFETENNLKLADALGWPAQGDEAEISPDSYVYLAVALISRGSAGMLENWSHITQALADVKPVTVRVNLGSETSRDTLRLLRNSCHFLEGVNLHLSNIIADGEYAYGITLNDCNLRSVTISNGSIEGLWMDRAVVTGAVVLEDLVVQRGFYLNDLKARDVRIENVRAWRTGSTETEGFGGIDDPVEVGLNNAQVDDEIVVRNSSVKDFWASKAQAKVLRISDSKFSGVVELWGVEGGLLFFKGNQAKELTAWHSHWQTVEIADSDRNVGKIETITMNYLHADGRVYLAQTEIGTARMLSLRAGDIDFQCLRVRNEINLEDARSASFFGLSRIDASKINLKRVRAESLRFYNDDLSGLVASPTGADDAAVPTGRETRTSSLYADGKCQLESAVGVLDLEDAEFDRVRLATTIRQQLFANGAQIGSLIVPGNRSAFDAGADINLRHAEIGSLVLSLGALRPDSANRRQLSFEGATIGGISVFDRDKDDDSITINPIEAATTPDIPDHECENRNGQERLRCLYVDELLPAMGVTIDGGRFVSQDDGQYSGAVYRNLRAAAEREGYPELGQSLAIIQNDHYAASVASDDLVKSVFYNFGYAINRYGYENSRGVIILLFIWLGGFLILNHAFLLWLVSEPFRRLFPKYFSPEKVAEIDKHDRQSFIVSHIFLSVDRTIPTLGLDNEFAQPAAGQGQKFGPWVLAALYVRKREAEAV